MQTSSVALQHEFSLIGDNELRRLHKGDRIQLQRPALGLRCRQILALQALLNTL